jgi:hypothetical protein
MACGGLGSEFGEYTLTPTQPLWLIHAAAGPICRTPLPTHADCPIRAHTFTTFISSSLTSSLPFPTISYISY